MVWSLSLTLCDPMGCIAFQAPLSVEFCRKEYWSGLPFPFPRDLPHSGIKWDILHCGQILCHLSYQDSHSTYKKVVLPDFPDGTVDRNPPSLSRGPRFDPWSRKVPQAAEKLSPCTSTTEPACRRAGPPQQEKPPPREVLQLRLQRGPCSPQLEKAQAEAMEV